MRALVVAASLACGVAAAQPLDLKGLGDRALACQDFDEYVSGRWRQVTPIPPDRARIGSFDMLRDQSRAVVEQALQAALRDPWTLGTPGKRRVTRYCASGMDLASIW